MYRCYRIIYIYIYIYMFSENEDRICKHTTLCGTAGGGIVRFFGGGDLIYDLLSNLHSPFFP